MKNSHDIQSKSHFSWSAFLLAVLTTGVWNVAAVAGDHDDHDAKVLNEQIFQRSDTDRDGRLSRDEFEKMRMEADVSAPQEQSSQGLPATPHQAEAVRGFDDRESAGNDNSSANGLSDAQTTGTNDSARSDVYQQNDSSRSSTMEQSGSLRPTPTGQSSFSGSTPPMQ